MKDAIRQIMQSHNLENSLIEEMLLTGRLKKLKAGEILVSPEQPGNEMPVVLTGLLKVMRRESLDSEMLLYFLEAGDTCAMSLSCCLEGRNMSIHVIAEEDSEIWLIPMVNLDPWMVKYPSFRKFVFSAYQIRFNELLGTFDSVVFAKMDERVYRYLLDKKQASGSYIIEKTPEQIAKELNTSRVVVSRILKQLEMQEKIEQYRNRIEVL
ncbi:MAG: Crp/Fnr family transcriptional regulator [Cyclobacteriaceae bacterium]